MFSELEIWLRNNDVTQSKLARLLGVRACTISRIARHGDRPRPELALRIEEITGIDARRLLGIEKPQVAPAPASSEIRSVVGCDLPSNL